PTPKLNAGQTADVKIAYARSLEERGEYDAAEATYMEALKLNPQRADAQVHLAGLRDRKGKFAESAELYRKALALKPGNADIYCNLGYSYYLQRRFTEAETNLRQTLALRPDHRAAHNNLGLVLAQTDRSDEALAEFHRAGLTEADARNNLAYGLTLHHRWAEAREQYAIALRMDPSLTTAQKALHQLNVMIAKAGNGASAGSIAEAIPGVFVNGDPAVAGPLPQNSGVIQAAGSMPAHLIPASGKR